MRVFLPPVIVLGNINIHLVRLILLGRFAGPAGNELIRIGESTGQKDAGLVVGLALEELIVTMRELMILAVVDKNLGVVDDKNIVRVGLRHKNHIQNGDRDDEQEA